jgi:hypothetical protein
MLYRLAEVSYRLQLDGINPASLQEDYNNRWGRIAKRMPIDRNVRWTAEKVKYAWENSVWYRHPHIILGPTPWTEELSQAVNNTKWGLYGAPLE